jgi:hypothetical protein
MTLTDDERRNLIEQAYKANTYICGADGALCGLPKEALPYPCQTCKRNKHWREIDNE